MAFDKTPQQWLGLGYSLSGSAISLDTMTSGLATIGTVTATAATDVLEVSTTHYLKVGDRVQFTTTGTLPAGLSASTDYYVITVPSATTLTVSTTNGGTVTDITDTGTGTHSIQRYPSLVELTDAEANASTGDVRKMFYAMAEALYQSYNRTDRDDRPEQMSVFKGISPDVSNGTETVTYTLRFTTEGSREVADEPA